VKAALAIAALLVATVASAQQASRPGPYVIDIRGAMSGIPSASAFLPVVPPATLVPKRGFGIDVGGQVYLFNLGAARVGLGVDVVNARGTVTTSVAPSTSTTGTSTPSPSPTTPSTSSPATPPALSATSSISVASHVSIVSPQLSFNWGSRDGWSYLSAGYGSARISSEASGQAAAPASGAVTLTSESKAADAINYGGGARWFIKEHLAVGFDFRFQRIAKTLTRPATKVTVLSVGVSVR